MNERPKKPALGRKILASAAALVLLLNLFPFGAAAMEAPAPESQAVSQSSSESTQAEPALEASSVASSGESQSTAPSGESQTASSGPGSSAPEASQPESSSQPPLDALQAIAPANDLQTINDFFHVTLGLPATFQNYDIFNGAPMPYLRMTVTIVTQNQGTISGGKVLVPLASAAPDGKQYFTYSHVEVPAGIRDLVDEAGIQPGTGAEAGFLVIPLKQTVPVTTSADMSVYYAFDPQYKSLVLPQTVLWDNISATLRMDGQADGISPAANSVKTSATDDSYTDSYFLTPTEYVPGSVSNLRTRAVKSNEYKIKWATPEYTRRVYLPKGTQVTATGGYVAVPAKNTATHDCYELTNSTYSNNYAWGTGVDMLLDQRSISFILPVNDQNNAPYPPGTQFQVIMEFEYQLYGTDAPSVKPGNRKVFTMTSLDENNVELIVKNTHSTGGSIVPVSGIADGSIGNNNVSAISYTNYAQATTNPGNRDAQGVYGVLSQPSGTEKLNFNAITIFAVRETNAYPFNNFRYTYDVMNGDGTLVNTVEGTIQPTGTAELYTSANIAPASLPAGQYIDNITVHPVNLGGDTDALMPRNGFGILYRMKAWDNQKWPNGTSVPPTGSKVVMKETLYYQDAQGAPKEASAIYGCYYAESPLYPVAAFVMNDPMGNSKIPGETVEYQLQLNNNNTKGIFPWQNPVVAFKAPKYLSVVSMSENGTPVPYTDLQNGNYLVQLSGQIAANTSIARRVDITFKIAEGAPAGTYKVQQVFTASATQSIYTIDSLIGQYNTLPSGETAADYGLDTAHNFIWQVNPAGAIGGLAGGSLTHTPYTIIPFSSVTSHTAIKTNTTGDWVEESLGVPTAVGDDVDIRLTITNNGNATVNGVRLYNDITGITDGGKAKFAGLDNVEGWTPYYYSGTATPPSLDSVATISLTSANGWSTAAGSNVKAVMLVYTGTLTSGTAQDRSAFLPGSSLSPVFKFQVLQDNISVENQYGYSYVSAGLTQSFKSNKYGFSTETFSLNFSPNTNDTSVENMPATLTGDRNGATALTIPAAVPMRNGYTFAAWYTDAAYTSAPIAPGSSFETHGITTVLYAKWNELPPHAVSFKANGGTGTEVVLEARWNQDSLLSYVVTVPASSTYTRDGYTFKEWNTLADGTGTAYAPGSSLQADLGAVDIFAIWGGKILYSKGSDSTIAGDLPSDAAIYTGNQATIAGAALSKTGHSFAGWSAVEGSSTAEYLAGSSYAVSQNLTLYPVFTANEYDVTLASDAHGSIASTGGPQVAYGTEIDVTFTPNTGYQVNEVLVNGTPASVSGSSLTITVLGDTTVEVSFAPVTYTLTTVVDGSEVETISYTIEGGVTPSEPAKSGYSFTGWQIASGGEFVTLSTDQKSIETGSYGDVTLEALFVPLEYTISYEMNQGTNPASNPGTYTIEQAVTLASPTRPGYLFQGWTATGVVLAEGSTIPLGTTGNISLTANWLIETHTISLSPAGGYTFPTQFKGYSSHALPAHTVTVSATGNSPATNLQVLLEGTNPECFTLSKTTLADLSGTATDSFSVKPAENLPVGVYLATVTIAGDDGIQVSFAVSFSVKEEVLTGKTIYLYKDQVAGMTAQSYYAAGIETAVCINPDLSETKLALADLAFDPSAVQAAAGRYIVAVTSKSSGKTTEIVVIVQERTYSVTFRYNNGATDYKTLTEAGQLINNPGSPDYLEHSFLGWFAGDIKWDFSRDTMPESDLTLEAHWSKNSTPSPVPPPPPSSSKPASSSLPASSSTPASSSSASETSTSSATPASAHSVPASSAPSSGASISPGSQEINTASSEIHYISDQKIPLAAGLSDLLGDLGYKGVWSILNLFLTLVSLGMLAAMGIQAKKKHYTSHKTLLVLSFCSSVLAALLFFVTSDFSQSIVLFNQFTVFFLLIGILQAIILRLYLVKNQKHAKNK